MQPSCCNELPLYGSANDELPKYCKVHAKPGMILSSHIVCQNSSCVSLATHNYLNELAPDYCYLHASPGMIDIRVKLCMYCYNNAIYSSKYTQKQVCKVHKTHNMIDVTKPICISPSCVEVAIYNHEPFKAPMFCVNHKLANMVKLETECQLCKNMATHSYLHKRPTHCANHKQTS
jgi:hypothetical protein